MAACADKVGALGDALLILYEKGESLLAHAVKTCAHVIRRSIGREYCHTLQACLFIQAVDVIYTDIIVQLIILRLYVEMLVHLTFRQQLPYSVLVEAVRQNRGAVGERSGGQAFPHTGEG